MSDKEEITALVIRLRMYFAIQQQYINKTWQVYDFAAEPLNISYGRAMNIISKHKRIKHLSKEECIKELKLKSPIMLKVAMIDNAVK